eukprot:11898372-Heterocapsa_arctica.AAC.1
MVLRFNICLKLRCCAKLAAFCKEYNGDSGNARKPFKTNTKNLETPSKTFKAIYTCMCTPIRPTDINTKL